MPSTRPMPAMMPADEISSPYIDHAANWPISRNGEPVSSNWARRSRGKSLPRLRWRSRASSEPPRSTIAAFSAMSATSARMRSALVRKVSELGDICEVRVGMGLADQFDLAADVQVAPVAVGCDGNGIFANCQREAGPVAQRQAAVPCQLAKQACGDAHRFVKNGDRHAEA